MEGVERSIIKELYRYREVLEQSAHEYNPSHLANYTYDLVKLYNNFYQTIPVLKEENDSRKSFRLLLSRHVADRVAGSMKLLGIEVPDRM